MFFFGGVAGGPYGLTGDFGEGDFAGPDGILFKRVALGWQPRVHLLKMVRYTLEVPPHPGCQSPSSIIFHF